MVDDGSFSSITLANMFQGAFLGDFLAVQVCAAQRLSVFFAWVQPSLKYFVLEVLHILRGFAPAKQACKRAAAQLPPVQFIRKLL